MKSRLVPSNRCMKKFLTVVIAGSLALAASAQAQQSDDQHPSKKERPKERETPSEAQPGPNPQAARPTARPHTAPRAYPPASVAPYPQRRIPPVSVPQPRPDRNTQNQPAMQNPTAAPAQSLTTGQRRARTRRGRSITIAGLRPARERSPTCRRSKLGTPTSTLNPTRNRFRP